MTRPGPHPLRVVRHSCPVPGCAGELLGKGKGPEHRLVCQTCGYDEVDPAAAAAGQQPAHPRRTVDPPVPGPASKRAAEAGIAAARDQLARRRSPGG